MSGLLLPLLPDGVFGAEVFDTGQDVPLAPEDEALAQGASQTRRRDVALGRACARAALGQMGVTGTVGRAPHGAPLWPPGVTGSITHTRGYAAAVVARDGRALGIDAEEAGRVEEKLWPRLFTDDERAWLAGQGDIAVMATVLFAAKEAAFKTTNPGAGVALQFQGFQIDVTGPGTFQVRSHGRSGRYVTGNGLVLALVF